MPRSTKSTRSAKNHCKACKEADNDRMVSCCHCGSWWHYECVGVNDSIADPERMFTCPECQRPSAQASVVRIADKKVKSVSSSCSSRAAKARLELEKLEAQKALAVKRLELKRREQERKHKEAELIMQQKKAEEEAELQKLELQMEETVINESFRLREIIAQEEADDDDMRSVTSEQSATSKVRKWRAFNSTMVASAEQAPPIDPNGNEATSATGTTPARQGSNQQPPSQQGVLEDAMTGISLGQSGNEPTLGGLIGRIESTIVSTAGKTMNAPLPPTARLGTSFSTQRTLLDQLPSQSFHVSPISNIGMPLPPNKPSLNNLSITSQVDNPSSRNAAQSSAINRNSANQSGGILSVTNLRGGLPPMRPIAVQPEQGHRGDQTDPNRSRVGPQRDSAYQSQTEPVPALQESVYCGPTPQQLAARHVMAKELPIFSGNPEDWPLFISAYHNSTQACGFTDAENLARLQRCLKGHALESVRSRLLLPVGVPHVLATLETLYGRPELLIHALLQKIRGVPAPKQERLDTLIGFGMAVQHFSDHLEAGRHEAHLNNPMLLFELVEKLPAHMKLDWALYKQRCEEVNIRSFAQYMQTLVRAATDVTLQYDPRQQQSQQQRSSKEKIVRDKNFCGAHASEESPRAAKVVEEERRTVRLSNPSCLICKNPEHRVKDCLQFRKKTVDDRWKTIQQFSLCRLCLGAHGRRPCKIRKHCDIDGCQRRHHPLLHSRQDQIENKRSVEEEKQGECDRIPPGNNVKVSRGETPLELSEPRPCSSKAATHHHFTGKTTLFRIIPVTLHGNNRTMSVYAFLDDGSEKSLIDEEIVKQLGVPGESQPLCLQWTSNVKRTEANSQRVALEISGRMDSKRYTLSDVRTVSKLDLPKQSMRYSELSRAFPYLKGLPVEDYDNAQPRILIGNDNAHVTSTLKLRDGQPGEPIAAKSRLGWTIYGSNQERAVDKVHSFHICEYRDNDQTLHDLVEQYFTVDSLGIMEVTCPESAEIQRAKRILQETTKRIGQRFETGLLWKYDCFEFPDSYQMAFRRLQCLERRMQNDMVIGESVKRQMSEYQMKGYIHKATQKELDDSDPRRTWYLPLGVVINPKKPSKIRIFCDAAAKVDGISLNSMLLKGPDLLRTLLDVLFGFREKRIALCADLKEMFHQIEIRKEDRNAQRLLWREDPTQEPEVYLMDVATFGATCSPCSAQFVKNRNAEELSSKFPAAADAIIRKHYVDDYLDSADNVEEAVKLAKEVKHVHSLGGFHLRNWLSNSQAVLTRVGENDPAAEKCLQLDKTSSTERVLGMYWKPDEDIFTFSTISGMDIELPTKRQALRVVMSPFDPAGLLSFFLIHGKILIQDLWRAKTDWDQPIPEKLRGKWLRWIELFNDMEQVRIPRCYFPYHSINDISSLQLHVYVDASEEAYACVGYLRAVFPDGIQVALVGGKSKVAPLKAQSIPRLELMAAVIGVRFSQTVLNGHSLNIQKVFFWSDSKTVLAWINSDHRNYKQFVACRVGEILSRSKPEQWHWTSTKKNVADEATKWGKGPRLSPKSRWFRGEEDLYLPEYQWEPSTHLTHEKTEEELRTCMVHHKAVIPQFVKWERFSSWTRLVRALGFVHRYSLNLQRKVTNRSCMTGPLSQEELSKAEATIYRWIQRENYADELETLSHNMGKQLSEQLRLEKSSTIRKLSPFLDESGIIRSDSRIAAATFVAYDTKFPTILPKEHPGTRLLIDWYHRRYLHANGETIVNEIRQRFHIAQLRSLVRKVAKDCTVCKIKKPIPVIPRMAPLPAARLQAYVRPFSYVGVDYFGPIAVRVHRSTVKRWVALFTCMTTRAVHLEIVHTLSAESCKMAFRRFIGRRGAPVEIRSDRGTNFVGSSNDLRLEMNKIDRQLAETFTNANTKWLFNPPGAPHMGGVWERLVRSVKTALAAMHTSRIPNEETLATVLVEAESVVNSRPLTYIPLETAQQEALTPNHFLLLSSSGTTQTPKTLLNPNQASRSDWNLCRTMVDQFWRRWVREYLPTIARRTKWFEEVKPIEVGDLVIIIEEKTRNGWIRGRVAKIVVGRDGRVRDAVVQTVNGMVHRPVAKLARLDIAEGKAGSEIPDQPYGSGNCYGNSHQPLATNSTVQYPSNEDCE